MSQKENSVTVSDIKILDLSPKIKIASELLPKTLKSEFCSFIVDGVHTGIANGIRRCMMTEIPVIAMDFNVEQMTTNDDFIFYEFVRDRIRNIPILQSTGRNSKFSLDVQNNTSKIISVTTANLMQNGKEIKGLCNETIEICELHPGRFIKIKEIYIEEGYGKDYGGFSVAHQAGCEVRDIKPYDQFTGEGVKSGVANAKKFQIYFRTNGNISPKNIIKLTIDTLIKRVEYVTGMLYTLEKTNDTYTLTLIGETETIRVLFMKTVHNLYPDIKDFGGEVIKDDKTCTFHINAENPVDVLNIASKDIIVKLKKIRSAFE